MKSKDLEKVVLSKYRKRDAAKQIYYDLNGVPRSARTKENIQKVKNRLRRKKRCQLEEYRWSLTYLKEVFGE